MAFSSITFNRGEGGLGRPLTGEDHISGIVFYIANANLPTGFSTSDRIKTVFSIEQAEALGIVEGGANVAIMWYHINEYFKMQPDGKLYIGLYDNTAIDYSVIENVQTFAEGEIRQIAVYDGGTSFSTANVTTLQASATTLQNQDQPLQVLYAADISGVADLSTLADLSALNNKNVSVVIGEDGAGAGAALAVSEGQSITALGACLGAVSLSSVHESIGWVAKFDVVKGSEFDEPAFANGDLVKNQPKSLLVDLENKHYIFLRKYSKSGTFFNKGKTAISPTSDYSTIENNRTIDKAVRSVREFMLPNINGPVQVNSDGTLSEDTVAKFQADAKRGLDDMLRLGEISSAKVLINPVQNVLSTGEIVVSIKIVPIGVSEQIVVNIGFAVSLT